MRIANPKRRSPSPVRSGMVIIAIFLAVFVTVRYGGPSIVSLLASASSSLIQYDAVAYFTPYDNSKNLKVGETARVDVDINVTKPANVFGATITFPVDTLEVVGIDKERSFMDLWTEETAIDELKGEVHFSGGTTRKGGLTGTGTAITLSVRAKKSGKAELTFKDAEIYSSDGTGRTLEKVMRSQMLTIDAPPTVSGGGTSGTSSVGEDSMIVTRTPPPPGPPASNPDIDGNGRVSIVDATLLVLRFIAPYESRFDLNRDGRIDWADVSVVFRHIN